MKRERILIIEDEPDILEAVQYSLAREGYRISGARDGEEGLLKAEQEYPDLILLDLMLPKIDGLEICRRLKGNPDLQAIPVIMVTAKGEADDVVTGLELGADDYVSKPFTTKVLLARIRAVLRRASLTAPPPEERIVRQGVVIDASRHTLSVEGQPVELTARQFRLLHALASNPGRVFSREQLLSKVAGDTSQIIDRNIDVHVGAVRKKLGDHRDLIQTIRGVGYRFREV